MSQLDQFQRLPSGLQRVVIASVFILTLLAVWYLREMMRVEEKARYKEEGLPRTQS